jgi:hypothetical protein
MSPPDNLVLHHKTTVSLAISSDGVDDDARWLPAWRFALHSSENGSSSPFHTLSNRLEAVVNLLYLVRLDRNNAGKVLGWVELADEELQQIAKILRDHFDH